MKTYIVLIATALLCVGCGDDESGKNNSDTNASSNGTPNGTPNGDIPWSGWKMTFDGGEDVFDLPDIDGDDIGSAKLASNLQFTGIDTDAKLTARIDVGDAVEVGDYSPTMFSVTWESNDYACSSRSVMITLTSVDPEIGTWSGDLGCVLSTNPSSDMITTTMSGEFSTF